MLPRIYIILCFSALLSLTSHSQLPPIGNWRDHLPYHQAIQVLAQNNGTTQQIWCATPFSLFSVDLSDKSIERWSKISGLSETGISAIGAESTSDELIIAYHNSNVDIYHNNTLSNIAAIKNTSIAGDKTIHHINAHNRLAYLSTGLGIIVIDLAKQEVKDTWIIGDGGNKISIFATANDANFLYAATAEGLKKAPLAGSNLADFRNWQLLSGANGLPAGPVQDVVVYQNTVIILKNDSLYATAGNNWQYLYEDNWTIRDLTVSNNKLLLCETQLQNGRVAVITLAGAVERIIRDPALTPSPRQAIYVSNNYWIADTLAGLSAYNGTGFERIIPSSPLSVAAGSMQAFNNILWAAGGAVNANWEPAGNRNGMYKFAEEQWNNFNAAGLVLPDSITDLITVAVDPVNESLWAGSYGGGLLNIRGDQSLTVYKQNSPIQPAYFSPSSYRVSGLAFDAGNNLWVVNYGAAQELHVRKTDGTWRSFAIPYPLLENAVAQIVPDDANQVWVVAPKGNGLFCFNYGQSVDNPGDDQWKWYRAEKGNGNLPDNNVLSIAKDKSGFIWVGTTRGIGLIQCPAEVFTTSGCEAILPVVQQDNFAGYLFRDEQVQCIVVDGADRKWIGTKNGVWLISADAEKTIYRFTENNSPLVSNDVQQIAIDGKTGEVFFATPKGICSFRSTATEGTATNSNVLVFPNPVPPGYNGTIAIRGVANNAIVKITELDGRLVYQTKALGGQAVWNGRNYKGGAVSTGVYLVLISDDGKKEQMATKIVFIKK